MELTYPSDPAGRMEGARTTDEEICFVKLENYFVIVLAFIFLLAEVLITLFSSNRFRLKQGMRLLLIDTLKSKTFCRRVIF